MSLISRALGFPRRPPPVCPACAKYMRMLLGGIEVCRHDPARPRFCGDFRTRAQAFGGCGVKGRFFEPREPLP